MVKSMGDRQDDHVTEAKKEPSGAGRMLELTLAEITDFRAGDTVVYERIFRLLWPIGYRTAHRILLDRDDAEESAQEGFVRAWNARRSFKGDTADALAAWIITMIRRNALDELRRRRMPRGLAEGDPEDPTKHVEDSETCAHVHRALETLEPADRAAMVLAEIEELPQSEIATLMNLSVGALKVRLHRARRRFREAYSSIVRKSVKNTPKGDESNV